jgi:hypothetical protein
MQSGNTKCSCFHRETDGRAKDKHYKIKDCPMRKKLRSREKCFRIQPLFDKDNILLPPLHINLELMNSFVKVMNKRVKGFEYMR